jgi:hypothetical protein
MKPASSDRPPIHHSPIFWMGLLCAWQPSQFIFGPTTSRGDRNRSRDKSYARFSYGAIMNRKLVEVAEV